VRNPALWNSSVVYQGQNIPGMESEWVFVMGSRQSYVSPAFITCMPINPFPNLQRVREKVFFGTPFHIS
jgi:hypothetical protein